MWNEGCMLRRGSLDVLWSFQNQSTHHMAAPIAGDGAQQCSASSIPPPLPPHLGHNFMVFLTWVMQRGSQSQSSLTKSRTSCCSMIGNKNCAVFSPSSISCCIADTSSPDMLQTTVRRLYSSAILISSCRTATRSQRAEPLGGDSDLIRFMGFSFWYKAPLT